MEGGVNDYIVIIINTVDTMRLERFHNFFFHHHTFVVSQVKIEKLKICLLSLTIPIKCLWNGYLQMSQIYTP